MNKFIARGKSKETGKFVYGYYFYEKNTKRHFIIKKDRIIRVGYGFDYLSRDMDMAEITQEPDRCLGIKDKDGKMIFEGDDIDDGLEVFKGIILSQYHMLSVHSDIAMHNAKIIGNIHGIKND